MKNGGRFKGVTGFEFHPEGIAACADITRMNGAEEPLRKSRRFLFDHVPFLPVVAESLFNRDPEAGDSRGHRHHSHSLSPKLFLDGIPQGHYDKVAFNHRIAEPAIRTFFRLPDFSSCSAVAKWSSLAGKSAATEPESGPVNGMLAESFAA